MKILIYSPLFYPSIGGLETVTLSLAEEWVNQGHEVQVICQTPAPNADRTKKFPFPVLRCPHYLEFWQAYRWCDLYFQSGLSLKGIWPWLLRPKPWFITHHTWYTRGDGSVGWQDHLKQWVSCCAKNIAVSQAIANHLKAPSIVIPNPYENDVFRLISEIPRKKELVFLGRLVSDKGVDLLIDALAQLKEEGLTPQLTIIGSGAEEGHLLQQVIDLNLGDQVTFLGTQVGEELVDLLNQHQIMVIPSRWQEPFGVVALEGLACGCVVVGSEQGGLKEAIGSSGVTFANNDLLALTQTLRNLLTYPKLSQDYPILVKNHLLNYHKSVVAQRYLSYFKSIINLDHH